MSDGQSVLPDVMAEASDKWEQNTISHPSQRLLIGQSNALCLSVAHKQPEMAGASVGIQMQHLWLASCNCDDAIVTLHVMKVLGLTYSPVVVTP